MLIPRMIIRAGGRNNDDADATPTASPYAQILLRKTKDKSVLTEDYKYFIAPDKPTKKNVSKPDKHGIYENIA